MNTPIVLKYRKLKLQSPLSLAEQQCVMSLLTLLPGMASVQYDDAMFEVSYRLSQTRLADIENALREADVTLSPSWVQRFRRSLIRYAEDNELRNQTARVSACCNRPPK